MSSEIQSRILIIDDDRTIVSGISLFLKKKGYQIDSATNAADAVEKLHNFNADLVLLDMNFNIDTSGKDGLLLLKNIIEINSNIPVILMTGWATVQLAVEGMKLGAMDFIAKPWDNSHLLSSIQNLLEINKPSSVNKSIQGNDIDSIIGQSAAFQDILNLVKHIAPTDANVLITGESGTGKEVIAEAIHSLSKRNGNEFVKVNLGGISSSLFESEMFGHKKGAFTDAHLDRIGRFAKAHKGTIFLDEIGDLPVSNQVKLLRVLQERTYEVLGSSETKRTDVRIISATNKNLEKMVYDGTFREDLFYRINLISIHMPSLNERSEDIPLLTDHFIKQVCEIYEVTIPLITTETYDWLQKQPFPGNIRQLKNMVERTLLININKKELNFKDFQQTSSQNQKSTPQFTLPEVGMVSLDDLEKQMIHKALDFHNHSISKTARSLSLTRSALYRRLTKHHIPYEPKN
ncbi:MAG: sigma-54-dependent Fis family transcriptional regulator [Saprospiraceae bacterium]|jgi:two-component system NtrC family response regulator|uniref:sigma-54-dependent transcriptional regulator n=1 Tax=Candidatus Brachybacter algidus TaxID=2982024 RepID=UPI001DB840FD|nr:sigma-54 dependent transcriptional regulator [Candidatus Brachybacter algidus]MBK6372337.1 sigma-54-dependent Fis family transcriptional regulator [Candidatus Brachybacter algidus]MBK6450164.1 sigma-54-dependent Fis family transcriptional regulator [Candidatus Brachybacter algidus]MBK7603256.1 sigma-54-dependent Fis family transcriptional regulator [Candidatus Brachybacter algidus]MBK8356655.1 sigma-54-dependent Fis family transcriptional regulator [Candidatus Brachybacter algidus]MBK884420